MPFIRFEALAGASLAFLAALGGVGLFAGAGHSADAPIVLTVYSDYV